MRHATRRLDRSCAAPAAGASLACSLVAAASLVACAGPDAPPSLGPTARPAVEVAKPGPSVFRLEGLDTVATNDACERCHADIAAEWRDSQHRTAWSDPVFLGAYAVEPLAFCRACHAPEAMPSNLNDPARHLGVGCVTCHVVGHDVVGARDVAFREDAHAVVAGPTMQGVGACEGCHQFEFPVPQDAAMQSTIEEHADSPQRGEACQTCHMPRVERSGRAWRSHAFRVHGDPEIIRSSLAIAARGETAHSIVVSLRATEHVGHAVPTGDMFRRLEVHATAISADGAREEATPVVLARHFRMEASPEGMRRMQIGDTRVPANGEPRDARLSFLSDLGERTVEWKVIYRRMGPREADLFGVDLAAEEVIVASGSVAPRASKP